MVPSVPESNNLFAPWPEVCRDCGWQICNDQEIRKATEVLTAKYTLNADQAKQMYTIQLRKAKNVAQITSFQNSDPALYRAKMQNVQNGTLASIRRILNTKAQVDLYQKTQAELRNQRAQKREQDEEQN